MNGVYWFDHLFDASSKVRTKSTATIETVQEWAETEDKIMKEPQSFRDVYQKAVEKRWTMEKVCKILGIKK